MTLPPGPSPIRQRLATQARLLRSLLAFSHVALMVALFVMWKHYQVPFATAFERCLVGGVLAYVVLGTTAAILATLARLQPMQLLLRHLTGAVSLVIFGALHYVYGMSILRSAGAWILIYGAARVLVGKIERRAMQRFRAER